MKRIQTVLFTTLTAASVVFIENPQPVKAQSFTQDPMATGAAASQGSVQQTVQNTTLQNLGIPGLGGGGGATNPAGAYGTAPFNPNSQTADGTASGGGLGAIGEIGGAIGNIGGALNQITGGFLGDIGNFLKNIPGSLEEWLGILLGDLGFSDTQEANTRIEEAASTKGGSASGGTKLAESLELNIPGKGSYNVRQDVKAKGERDTAIGIANSSALNKNAQAQLKKRAEQAEKITDQNIKLAEDSKKRDVTQQIMQNMSGQTALAAQIGHESLKEAQQARVDRAIGNVMNVQQARGIEEGNTIERRRGIAAGNTAIEQTGLMALPGGFYLGSEK
jgi:hypothetical protein